MSLFSGPKYNAHRIDQLEWFEPPARLAIVNLIIHLANEYQQHIGQSEIDLAKNRLSEIITVCNREIQRLNHQESVNGESIQ